MVRVSSQQECPNAQYLISLQPFTPLTWRVWGYPYTHYSRCRHALCGVHLLRKLTYFEEVSAETMAWAAALKRATAGDEGGGRARVGGGRWLAAGRLAERPLETVATAGSKLLGPLVPVNYRPVAVAGVARALLAHVPAARGRVVILSGEMRS